MLTLILIVIFGLGFGYFATQNTSVVFINFWEYSSPPVPVYLIILISIGIGILLTMIFNFLKWFSSSRKLSKKERDLQKTESEVNELTKEVHKLQLENTKLEAQLGKSDIDEDSI